MPGAHQMIRAGLARGVRRVRRVRRLFLEQPRRSERPIHFVGRDVQEPEPGAGGRTDPGHVVAGRLEQFEGADEVRLNERRRAVDRPVHVRLGGEIEHRRRLPPIEERRHRRPIGDVALDEGELRMVVDVAQALEAACIGQLVEDDHADVAAGEGVSDEVRTDETGAAGDDPGVVHATYSGDPRDTRAGQTAAPVSAGRVDGSYARYGASQRSTTSIATPFRRA